MILTPTRRASAVASLALVALLALPGIAFASTNPQIAATGGMTATLPILGGGVAVTVALDAAGDISGVTVGNPALAKTSSSTDFAKFATADGKTSVTVKAAGSKMSISARVTTLADLVGTGNWSANVFGNGVSSAQYTIGDDGSGNPTVSLTTPSPLASGVTWTPGLPGWGEHADKPASGAVAVAGGQFTDKGLTKTLKVMVAVHKGENGGPGSASLKITLTGRDAQSLTGSLADLAAAGQRTWSAYLCDGTTKVTVTYHVNADGTIGYDGATGGTAIQKSVPGGALVVFFQGTRVGLAVGLRNNGDGTSTLKVRGMSGFCGNDGGGKHGWQGGGGNGDGFRSGQPVTQGPGQSGGFGGRGGFGGFGGHH